MPAETPNNHVSTFPYPGGKGRESDWLIKKMPPHRCYVEVFGGSAALLYNKPESQCEVYNDTNDDLVQFFEALRNRGDELAEWLESVPYSRSLYEEWVNAYFNGHRPEDPIERAGRFFYLRYTQFAGDTQMVNGFKTRNYRSPARTFNNARERLEELAERFSEVIIEHRDWREILEGYDDDHVLFYCDPPYVGSEHYYGTEFDHASFVKGLADLDGDWMVSYCELPDGLGEYNITERERRHRMTQGDSKATERLITNFDFEERPQFVDTETRQKRLNTGTDDRRQTTATAGGEDD